jgi:hypothetical protein
MTGAACRSCLYHAVQLALGHVWRPSVYQNIPRCTHHPRGAKNQDVDANEATRRILNWRFREREALGEHLRAWQRCQGKESWRAVCRHLGSRDELCTQQPHPQLTGWTACKGQRRLSWRTEPSSGAFGAYPSFACAGKSSWLAADRAVRHLIHGEFRIHANCMAVPSRGPHGHRLPERSGVRAARVGSTGPPGKKNGPGLLALSR